MLAIISLQAKSQITENRWEIISSQNFDLYLPKSSDLDYYRLLSDAEKHLEYCENLYDFHLNESIRLVLSRNENIVKIPVSLNNSNSTEVEFDRHTGYIVSNNDYEAILLQVKNAIVAILFNDLMYGKSFQDRIQNKAILQVQSWFAVGLAAYCNEPWAGSYDGQLRDYFLAYKNPGFNLLIERNEVLAGYSFWKFLVDQYGEQNIANVLYISHLSRSIESGLNFVYGKTIPDLMEEWRAYYREIYSKEFNGLKEEGAQVIAHTEHLENISVSPDGKWLAGVHYEDFKTKIYCMNLKSKKRTLINTSNGVNEVILRWRDMKRYNELLYKITTTGQEQIVFYNPSRNKNTKYLNIKDFDKLLNFEIDALGNYVFYGVNKSKTYLLWYSGKTQELLTLQRYMSLQDIALNNGAVYFTTLEGNTSKLIRYTNTYDTLIEIKPSSVFNILHIDSVSILYTANYTGLNQIYRYDLLSKSVVAMTEYSQNTKAISTSANLDYGYYSKGSFEKLRTYSVLLHEIDTAELPWAYFVQHPRGMLVIPNLNDTVTMVKEDTASEINTRYYFVTGFNEADEKEYQHALDSIRQAQKENKINLSLLKSYELNFATLKVSLLQLDNTNFFNMIDLAPLNPNGLQYYYYYNYLKSELSMKDILNKYQLLGGLRLSTNLGGGYDAYVKFEKTFRRYVFQTSVYYNQKRFETLDRNLLKQQIQNTSISYTYKYTNTVNLKIGSNIMPYRNTILSTERFGLIQKNVNTVITSLYTEFQYNRIKKYSDFLYRGISVTVQPLVYYNTSTNHVNSMIKGMMKYYRPLYRRIVWSTQMIVNASGGEDKVVNILGGAENWIFTKYDEQNQISRTMNYQLRSYAGAIRGFKENARSGNNSFCINSEIRIPLSTLLSKWPTDRDWYQTLLLIPFADFGSAWNGVNLFNTNNNYTVRVFDYTSSARNIASVEVKNLRDPLIGSFGCGISTRLIGYNARFDMAFGVEDGIIHKPMYLFSYGTNF